MLLKHYRMVLYCVNIVTMQDGY